MVGRKSEPAQQSVQNQFLERGWVVLGGKHDAQGSSVYIAAAVQVAAERAHRLLPPDGWHKILDPVGDVIHPALCLRE